MGLFNWFKRKKQGELVKTEEPASAKVWLDKGNSLIQLRKYEKAIECYDKALKINPKSANALTNKGVALELLGKHQESIDCFKQAENIVNKS